MCHVSSVWQMVMCGIQKKVPHWAHFLVSADREVTNIKNVAPMAMFFMLGEWESS